MTDEAREIARKILIEQNNAGRLILGGEIFITEPIDPPKKYRKETKDAWNNLMRLYVEHGALNQRDLPRFRIMFDNLDYYYTASETIEKATEQAGKVSPAAIYGNLKDVIAARDTFARNYEETAKIFDARKFKAVTEDSILERAVDEVEWRLFEIEHNAEDWEEYKKMYCEQNGYAIEYFDSMEFFEDEHGY